MKFWKTIILGISSFTLISSIAICPAFGQTAPAPSININFFYSKTCPHCVAENKFLDKLGPKYPDISINRYLISDKNNFPLLEKLCKECNAERYLGLVPLTFVNKEFFLGFDNEEGIGVKIENAVKKILENLPTDNNHDVGKINLPVIGEIDAGNYSLPVLTIILGFLDGFNICSLGALVFILGLVLAFRSRKKILFFGGIFILTTAIIYGFLMTAWYHLFSLFSSYIKIMNILVGIIAIIGGIYFFKQFADSRKQALTCKTGTENKTVSRLSARLSDTFQNRRNIFIILGAILLFAAVITIIEFPCSAAVPLVYTGILSQANVALPEYLVLMTLYLLLYMLDEIIVFLVAVFTMKLWLSSPKFTAYITLIEGIILALIGGYYLSSWLF